jgi:hypothetical protein
MQMDASGTPIILLLLKYCNDINDNEKNINAK